MGEPSVTVVGAFCKYGKEPSVTMGSFLHDSDYTEPSMAMQGWGCVATCMGTWLSVVIKSVL